MLRITVEEQDNATSLRLEGKLTGDWVGELERCWISNHNHSPVSEFSRSAPLPGGPWRAW